MKNIVLVIPENKIDADPMVYPPLGLLYIAAVLENSGHQVSIFDMRKTDNDIENIPLADFYCFTAVTPQIVDVIRVSEYVKHELGGITILGGAHASWVPDTVREHFDAIVVGEGEDVILDIIDRNNRGIINSNLRARNDINQIPFPSRHLMPSEAVVSKSLWDGYRYIKDNSPVATTIISSRGCPWRCGFCANLPQPIRFRSAENVTDELKEIIDNYGCKHFRFLDDNFILKKSRLKKMAAHFQDLGINFRCSGRSDLLDTEVCEMLAASGCKEIGFGVESGDDNVSRIINKKESTEDHKRAISLAKEFGMKTKVFLMAGLPGETWESIEMTKRFIEETKPDKWIVTLFTPYPGSPISKNPDDYSIQIVDNDFAKYVQTFPTKSNIRSNLASREELGQHYDELISLLRKMYDV